MAHISIVQQRFCVIMAYRSYLRSPSFSPNRRLRPRRPGFDALSSRLA
jgi:hypothetical protein